MEYKPFQIILSIVVLSSTFLVMEAALSVGQGNDFEPLSNEGTSVTLGGITIPAGFSVTSANDGDVLSHAIAQALLGAAGVEILNQGPMTTPAFIGGSRMAGLRTAVNKISEIGAEPVNIDAIIGIEPATLDPWINDMKLALSRELRLPLENVNIRSTIPQTVGFSGPKGLTAHALALVRKQEEKGTKPARKPFDLNPFLNSLSPPPPEFSDYLIDSQSTESDFLESPPKFKDSHGRGRQSKTSRGLLRSEYNRGLDGMPGASQPASKGNVQNRNYRKTGNRGLDGRGALRSSSHFVGGFQKRNRNFGGRGPVGTGPKYSRPQKDRGSQGVNGNIQGLGREGMGPLHSPPAFTDPQEVNEKFGDSGLEDMVPLHRRLPSARRGIWPVSGNFGGLGFNGINPFQNTLLATGGRFGVLGLDGIGPIRSYPLTYDGQFGGFGMNALRGSPLPYERFRNIYGNFEVPEFDFIFSLGDEEGITVPHHIGVGLRNL